MKTFCNEREFCRIFAKPLIYQLNHFESDGVRSSQVSGERNLAAARCGVRKANGDLLGSRPLAFR